MIKKRLFGVVAMAAALFVLTAADATAQRYCGERGGYGYRSYQRSYHGHYRSYPRYRAYPRYRSYRRYGSYGHGHGYGYRSYGYRPYRSYGRYCY